MVETPSAFKMSMIPWSPSGDRNRLSFRILAYIVMEIPIFDLFDLYVSDQLTSKTLKCYIMLYIVINYIADSPM